MIRARTRPHRRHPWPRQPAPDRVLALAQAGVDVFRLNFSHGAHADHAAALEAVRAAEAVIERPLAVLADLQGPKFRLGEFKDGKVEVEAGPDLPARPRSGARRRHAASACRIRSCSPRCARALSCCSTTARCG